MTDDADPERRRQAPPPPARRHGPPPPSGQWLVGGVDDDDLVRPASDEESDPGPAAPQHAVSARPPTIAPAAAPPPPAIAMSALPPATAASSPPPPAITAPSAPPPPVVARAPDPFAPDPFAPDPFADDPLAALPSAPPSVEAPLAGPDPFADLAPPAPRPAPAPAEAPRRSLLPPPRTLRADSDSDALSSAGSRVGPPLPSRRRAVMPLLVGVSIAALLVVPAIVWLELDRRHADRQRSDFLATYESLPVTEALALGEALPEAARSDPRVARALAGLRERARRDAARGRAQEVLAQLASTDDAQAALALCDRAIVIDDTFATAYLERARLRLRQPGADPDEARRAALVDLAMAIEKEPEAAQARYVRASLLLLGNEREREDARRELRQVSELDALGGLGAMARARLELLEGTPEAARRALDTAVERLPRDPEPLVLRAEVWLLLGEPAAARRDATAALRLDPRSAPALALRAEARWAGQGDLVGARKDLEEALRLDRDLPRALALRADLRVAEAAGGATGGLDDALRDADLALRRDPGLARAHLVRAEVAAARGQADAAIQHATRAIEASRGLARAWLLRGRLRQARGQHGDALHDFGQALRLDPDNVEALTRRAGALVHEKRYDQARADLDRVLQQREVPEAYLYRGVATLRSSRGVGRCVHSAVEDLTRAIQLSPRLVDAYFHRGEAYYALDRFAECLADLDQAERLLASGARPTSFGRHELSYLRGHCRFQQRQWPEALAAYARYLEIAPPGEPGIALARRRAQQCRDALEGRRDQW